MWAAVLGAAKKSPIPGVLLLSASSPMTDEEIAEFAGVPVRDMSRTLERFAADDLGMVERSVDHHMAWRVTKWDSRQFESDDVTKRTGKYRSQQHHRNVPGNVPLPFEGTRPEAEADTEAAASTAVTSPPPTSTAAAAALGQPANRENPQVNGTIPILDRAVRLLAERHLAASRTPVGNPGGWLRNANRAIRVELADRIATTNTDEFSDAEQLANWLEPTREMPREMPRGKLADERPECATCDQAGMILDAGGNARRCPDCNPIGAAR
jgi:hypothetical protein